MGIWPMGPSVAREIFIDTEGEGCGFDADSGGRSRAEKKADHHDDSAGDPFNERVHVSGAAEGYRHHRGDLSSR